jgi:hypothetical protein
MPGLLWTVLNNSYMTSTDRNRDTAGLLRFASVGLEITLFYNLGREDRFIEKWLEIKSEKEEPYFLKSWSWKT